MAAELGCVAETEDTISLLVQWQKKGDQARSLRLFTRPAGLHRKSWRALESVFSLYAKERILICIH
jgi:hypothetical protein